MADLLFVDANVFLRHFLQDHADHSPRATAFLQRIEVGEQHARTAETVVFETVYTLERTYGQSRTTIRDIFLPILLLRTMMIPNKRRVRRTFALYVVHPKLSFADCYHIALMESLKLKTMVTFDRKIGQVQTVIRAEPDAKGLA